MNLTSKQVLELSSKNGVMEYVMSFYESLHTTGWQYTVEDIDEFIAVRKTA